VRRGLSSSTSRTLATPTEPAPLHVRCGIRLTEDALTTMSWEEFVGRLFGIVLQRRSPDRRLGEPILAAHRILALAEHEEADRLRRQRPASEAVPR